MRLADIKSGKPKVSAPVYSHLIYDRTGPIWWVDQPDILILEGLNVLQTGDRSSQTFVSDFVDFYLWDADEDSKKRGISAVSWNFAKVHLAIRIRILNIMLPYQNLKRSVWRADLGWN